MWVFIRIISGISFSVLSSLLWKLLCFLYVLTLCQICSYGATVDLQGHNRLRNLKFNGWHLFWFDLDHIELEMLNLQWFRQWSWKYWRCLKRANMSLFGLCCLYFWIIWSDGLEGNQNLLQCYHVSPELKQMWLFCTGEWPDCLWLGIH